MPRVRWPRVSFNGMTARSITWPKLIGVIAIVLGIALSLRASAFLFDATIDPFGPTRAYLWPLSIAGVGCAVSLIVGVGVYSGRQWARVVLIGVTVVAIVPCVVYAYSGVTRSISAMGPLEPQWVFWSRLLFVGEALREVAPPVFFLLVLLHPDVAESFNAPRT